MESLLRCPLCAQPLDRQDTRYLCPRGHSFDRAAAGYVHLLPANKLHSKDPGDDKAMAAARNRFLSGGYYDPLRDALTRLALAYAPDRAQILDAGRETKEDVISYLLAQIGDPGQVVMVGDTAFDVLGAKVHGIPTIGVTWGYGQVEAMREAGAAALADTPEQLEALLHTPGVFSPAPPQALP